MKTGRAYAFLNYEGRWTQLVRDLEVARQKANFSDTLRLMIIGDKISTMNMDQRVHMMYDCERGRLPEKIAEVAKRTKVHGQAPVEMARYLSDVKPVNASSLRYLVMAEDTDAVNVRIAGPLGQGRANDATAGMLDTALDIVAERERRRGAGIVSRKAVFYLDSRGRVQSL